MSCRRGGWMKKGRAQQAGERRQADDDRSRDQDIADDTEKLLAGAAEQRRAEPNADAVDRTDQERKSYRVGGDEPGQRIAPGGKEGGRPNKTQDIGARNAGSEPPA